jgi:hypothetical protein
MGRPTKLSAKRTEAIVAAVRDGAPRQVAAAAGGVARRTLQTWITRGESADSPPAYRGFAEALRGAEAEAELAALRNIAAAGREDWRASAWYLERCRDGYAKRTEISGPDGGRSASKAPGISRSSPSASWPSCRCWPRKRRGMTEPPTARQLWFERVERVAGPVGTALDPERGREYRQLTLSLREFIRPGCANDPERGVYRDAEAERQANEVWARVGELLGIGPPPGARNAGG